MYNLEKTRRSDPSTLQLARGIVEQGKVKGRDLCLKLTSTIEKAKIIYLSFHDQREYEKWYIRCKKVIEKVYKFYRNKMFLPRIPFDFSDIIEICVYLNCVTILDYAQCL